MPVTALMGMRPVSSSEWCAFQPSNGLAITGGAGFPRASVVASEGGDRFGSLGAVGVFLRALTPLHIVLLAAVALLVFGPRRLPELGGAIGKTLTEFKKSMNEAKAEEASAASDRAADATQQASARR